MLEITEGIILDEISMSSPDTPDKLIYQDAVKEIQEARRATALNGKYAAADEVYQEYMESEHFTDWIFPEWLESRLNSTG